MGLEERCPVEAVRYKGFSEEVTSELLADP